MDDNDDRSIIIEFPKRIGSKTSWLMIGGASLIKLFCIQQICMDVLGYHQPAVPGSWCLLIKSAIPKKRTELKNDILFWIMHMTLYKVYKWVTNSILVTAFHHMTRLWHFSKILGQICQILSIMLYHYMSQKIYWFWFLFTPGPRPYIDTQLSR